jgi:hypothetical protein
LPGKAAPGAVRYATGMAAHAPGELTLDCGEAIRTRAAQAARLDPLDPAVLRLLFTVRVRANDALKAFIDRTGMTYRAADGPLADHYRLEADPAYQALRDRCRAEGKADGVDLAMLDPRCRSVLQDEAIEDVLDSLALPGQAAPGTVRYATGMAAHAPGELTLDCGEAIRTRAAQAARLDPLDPAVLRLLFTVRVRANDALKAFIDRTGMTYRAADGPLADHYRLEADDDGLLHIRYRLLAGGRYAGRFDVGRLTARLAAALAARPDLAREKGQPDEAPPPAVFRPDGTDGDDELRRQLRILTPEGASLKLPIQALSRLPDIRRAVEQAGGVYRPRRQQFDFPDDIAAADVLARLLALAS